MIGRWTIVAEVIYEGPAKEDDPRYKEPAVIWFPRSRSGSETPSSGTPVETPLGTMSPLPTAADRERLDQVLKDAGLDHLFPRSEEQTEEKEEE
jgi:hypothetical protein